MTFRGVVRDGRVELEGGVSLPEGTPVEVQPAKRSSRKGKRGDRSKDPAFDLSQFAVRTGRRDGSLEHDHYIYGSPKRNERPGKRSNRKPAAKARKRS